MTKLLCMLYFLSQAHEHHGREKNFYLKTIPEVLELITPAEKQEILARIEEIKRLDQEIQQIRYNKKTRQALVLAFYNSLADSINHHPQKSSRNK